MNTTAVFINVFALVCLIGSLIQNKTKTTQSLRIAAKSFVRIIPVVLVIIVFIGLLLAFIPASEISKIVGEQSGLTGIFIVSFLGAVMHIPSLISFPLAASLLRSGASIAVVSAFITTLTMIGVVTLPMEIKELGRKIALLRNGMSFIIAILIALIMGAIL